jgi:MFS family permease
VNEIRASQRAPIGLGQALDDAVMSSRHRRFWLLAALGVLLDGFDFFVIGIVNPLIKEQYSLSPTVVGLVSAAAIVGAIFGAGLLGPLADRIGRRRIFKVDLWIFVVFSFACAMSPWIWTLIVFRFMVGVAIGLDYPIAASYLSEVLPKRERGRWLVGAFSLQAAGILLAAVVGLVILLAVAHDAAGSATSAQIGIAWRSMLAFGAVPALVIIWLRRTTPESPRWLAQNGREAEAVEVAEELTGVPIVVTDTDRCTEKIPTDGIRSLFQPALFRRDMIRRTILTAVPWFLMDVATYGVGIFTPTLLVSIFVKGGNTSFLIDDIATTKGTAVLDVFLPLGFLVAILLVDRVGRIPLQLTGFAMMTVALVVLAVADGLPGGGDQHIVMVFVGFATFNFFMNAGPNSTTYALPAEVFPSEVRAAGHGFATASAKLGAALGVFFFPILLADWGTTPLLLMMAGGCVVAMAVTRVLRIETMGVALPANAVSGRSVATRGRR